MSDTPDKKNTPASEPTDSAEKKSPWFVTPMGDKQGDKQENKQEDKQDEIKIQPEEKSEAPEAPKEPAADHSEKSSPTAPTAPAPKPGPAAAAPKPAAPKPAAPKPVAPKPAASKPGPKAPTSKSSPTANKSKVNPLAGGSSITFDDDEAGSDGVSTPMLVVDGLAAAIAITFTVLILQDVLPFLN